MFWTFFFQNWVDCESYIIILFLTDDRFERFSPLPPKGLTNDRLHAPDRRDRIPWTVLKLVPFSTNLGELSNRFHR